MALLQQTVDSRLSGLGPFLDQTKERIESLERGLGETMAYVQTMNANSGSPLTQNESRVLLLVQSGIMTRDEARQQLGLGVAPTSRATVTEMVAAKRGPGRPRKASSVEQEILKEITAPEA